MKTKLLASLLGLALALTISGCATGPSPKVGWVATSWKDQFTDIDHALVTMGSYYTSDGNVYTVTGGAYPFIGRNGNQLLVGLRSGGKIRFPVGEVQLRIDDNPAWTITPMETPLENPPGTTPASSGPSDQIAAAIEKTRQLSSVALLPYTAATGERARKILGQMLHGHIIKYRITSFGQASSTTGECLIDDSFREGLIKAAIPFADLL